MPPKNYKTQKSTTFMFEQQVAYLPNNMTPNEFYDYTLANLKPPPIRIALILHDKDVKDDGVTPAKDHIHMVIEFENPRSLSQVAKELGVEEQWLEIWRGKRENAYSYLIHATDNSRDKYQYSCEDVIANFDYTALIKEISDKVSKVGRITSKKKMDTILDLIGCGEATIKEVKAQLTGSEYANNSDKIKKAHELFLERKAEELHSEMIKNNELVACHWFYGVSETGKSFLAEKLASESGPYYKTTTTKDAFQFYQAEPILILDELRQHSIPYSELLALLNPFSKGNVAVSSRFYNKALAVKTVYITTPLDPIAFYGAYKLNDVDSGMQLYRRLSSVLRFDMDFISKMEYMPSLNAYVETGRKPNPYSKRHQQKYELTNVFDQI